MYQCTFYSNEIKQEGAQKEIARVNAFLHILQCHITNFMFFFITKDKFHAAKLFVSKRARNGDPVDQIATMTSDDQLKNVTVEWWKIFSRLAAASGSAVKSTKTLKPELFRYFEDTPTGVRYTPIVYSASSSAALESDSKLAK